MVLKWQRKHEGLSYEKGVALEGDGRVRSVLAIGCSLLLGDTFFAAAEPFVFEKMVYLVSDSFRDEHCCMRYLQRHCLSRPWVVSLVDAYYRIVWPSNAEQPSQPGIEITCNCPNLHSRRESDRSLL